MIKKIIVGQLQTNCYLYYEKEEGKCFIIDPGDDAGYIMNKIKDLGLIPKAILATHGHFDHLLAVSELKLAYDIPFYLNRKDLAILKRQQSTAKFFTGLDTDPPAMPDRDLKEGDFLKIDSSELMVIETSGHTPGGVSFYNEKKKMIFVGDLVFKNGVGRTDLKGGNWKQLQHSIQKIKNLADELLVFPGHGEEFRL